MPVKVSINKNWSQDIIKGLDGGVLEIATAINTRAAILAPRDTGALAGSGKVAPVTNGYSVTYGSGRVPYARRRHFENKKNPQTLEYLSKAGDSVARGNTSKYFRGKV